MRVRSITTGARVLIASILVLVGAVGIVGAGVPGVDVGGRVRAPVSRKAIGSIVLSVSEDRQSPVLTMLIGFLPAQQRT